MVMKLNFHCFQTQTVKDYRNRAERHGRSGNHRVEQETVEGEKHAGSNRDANDIIDESPKQVLPDTQDRLLRKFQCFGDGLQVRSDERKLFE